MKSSATAAMPHRYLARIGTAGAAQPRRLHGDYISSGGPTWRPDGSALAWDVLAETSGEMWLLPVAEEARASRLAREEGGNLLCPRWSPGRPYPRRHQPLGNGCRRLEPKEDRRCRRPSVAARRATTGGGAYAPAVNRATATSWRRSRRRHSDPFTPLRRVEPDADTLALFHFDNSLEAAAPRGLSTTPGPAQ